jgi:hypothetical protein
MKSTLALSVAFSMALFVSCSSAQNANHLETEKASPSPSPASDPGTAAPVCDHAGTRSEGWVAQGKHIQFANCSGQIAQCEMQGTRSEGWYASKKDTSGKMQRIGLIQFANCSGK